MNKSRLGLVLVLHLMGAAPAWAVWQQNGNPMGGNQRSPAIVSDGAGGAIIAWEDWRSDGDIYVRRIDASGNPLWTVGGVALCLASGAQSDPAIVSDGAGGAIVAWTDARSGSMDIYARRVNAAGTPLWAADGVAMCNVGEWQWQPIMVSDGAGGAIVAWADNRNLQMDVFARRIDASGNPLWTSGGVPICTALGNQYADAMVADGAGGAILAWGDGNVFAQRINASGSTQWTANGVALCTAPGGQGQATIASDGASGAIVAWSDNRNDPIWPDLYARRINAAGNPLWIADGVAVCPATHIQTLHSIVSDGVGGAILAWSDGRNVATAYDLYVQRINASGSLVWNSAGVPMDTATGDQSFASIVSDGASGAVVTWLDLSSGTETDVYAQRVANSGGAQWTVGGVAVCIAVGTKSDLVSTSDGNGSAIAAWTDGRVNPTAIYAQRVEFKYGYWGFPEPIINSVIDMPSDQGGHVMLEWQASQRDIPGQGLIDYYSIWSANDDPGAPWEQVGIVPAEQQSTYTFVAHTSFDSGPQGPFKHFQVFGHAQQAGGPDLTWPSNIVEGYSLDNLPPPPPSSLTAERLATGAVHLRWSSATAPDLHEYAVYRWKTPGPSQFLMSSTDTTAIDADAPNGELHYVVTARDVHGNESLPSNEAIVDAVTGIGDAPSITALTVLQNHPNPFAATTDFEIGLPKSSDLKVEVFDVAGRRVSELAVKGAKAGWQRIPFAGRDGQGRPLASGVYFYRVTAGGSTATRKMVVTR